MQQWDDPEKGSSYATKWNCPSFGRTPPPSGGVAEGGFGPAGSGPPAALSRERGAAWRDASRRGGRAGLRAKPVPGRPPKLTVRQRRRLVILLGQGACAHG